jgi:hypothetical protein
MNEHCAGTASGPLDVVIISWQGQHENAAHIARALIDAPDLRVFVIYSNAAEAAETGAGEWIGVPNAHFFGWKFRRALDCVREDARAMVIIQADARAADWSGLLARCSKCFKGMPDLGLWAPRITYTPWIPQRVDIAPVAGTDLMQVAQTDGIVLGLASPVVARLRQLDYGDNNLGWGIDSVAIAFSLAHGLMVVRDDGCRVERLRLAACRSAVAAVPAADDRSGKMYLCLHVSVHRRKETDIAAKVQRTAAQIAGQVEGTRRQGADRRLSRAKFTRSLTVA